MGRKEWRCIEISCDPEWVESLGFEIGQHFGVATELADCGVRFYLDARRWNRRWDDRLRQFLADMKKAFGLTRPLTWESSLLEDADWAWKWKENFKPFKIGRHFWISPQWEEFVPPPGDLLIRIDPGRAFGTGHHETTRLCLLWLEEHGGGKKTDMVGRKFLDVGTGTGVLAIAAELQGFSTVVGIDTDPDAIEMAQKNLTINPQAGHVHLVLGSVNGVQGRFDVIMANIELLPLIDMADDFIRLLRSSGRLVLSGILAEQEEKLRRVYEDKGMRCRYRNQSGEWCLLEWVFYSEV